MADKTQAPVQTEAPAPTTTPELPATTSFGSNAEAQEKVKGKSAGQLSWEGALGEMLGSRLYGLLADQLTDQKLLGHANSIVSSAVDALKGKLDGNVAAQDADAAAMFVAELDKGMREVAQRAVSGIGDDVRGFVDQNPYPIALAAVAGAVAYVLSNQDLPLLEGKLGLGGGHSVVAGVDPGRTMELALQQVRVGYRYQGGNVKAEVNADRFQDGYSVDGKVQYALSPDSSVSLAGSHSDRAGVTTSRVEGTYVNPELSANAWFQNQVGGTGPQQTVGASVLQNTGADGWSRRFGAKWGSDNSWEASAGMSKSVKNGSYGVEGFGGQTGSGQSDYGVRAFLKFTF